MEGRTFEDQDHQERLGTLIMSEGVKERFWPDATALGKRMETAGAGSAPQKLDRSGPELLCSHPSGERERMNVSGAWLPREECRRSRL